MKKEIISWLVCFGLVLSTAMGAFAADKPTVLVSRDGRRTVATPPARGGSPYVNDNTDSVIFSNLGGYYPAGVYTCCLGNAVFGPANTEGQPEVWEAAGFTPTTNMTVTRIKVAVGWVNYGEKYSDVLLTLAADNGGIPGTPLRSWKVPISSAIFGTCCIVESRTADIAVTAGSLYWVVVTTESASDVWAVWNFNDTQQLETQAIPTAIYCGDSAEICGLKNNQWVGFEDWPGYAFEVDGN